MAIYKDVEPLEVVAYKGESEEFDRGVTFILEQLDALPTADVAEVVRCKNCVYFEESNNGCFMCGRADGLFIFPAENDFCSYGERKEQ